MVYIIPGRYNVTVNFNSACERRACKICVFPQSIKYPLSLPIL